MTAPVTGTAVSSANPRRWGILWLLATAQLMLILDAQLLRRLDLDPNRITGRL